MNKMSTKLNGSLIKKADDFFRICSPSLWFHIDLTKSMRVASIFNFLIALVSVVIAQSEYKVIQKTLTSTSVSLEL